MQLDAEQRKVATKLIRIGRRRGESKRNILTALTTGLTEASLHNPSGGEGTSAGWRQEINSYGSVRNRTNIARSANRFYGELKGVGGSIGNRAQSVQRSAFPGRYAEHVGEARAILHQLSGRAGGGQMAAPKQGGSTTKTTKSSSASTATDQQALRQTRLALVENLDLTGKKDIDVGALQQLKAATTPPATTTTTTTTKGKEQKGLGGKTAQSKAAGKVEPVNVPHTRGKAIKIGSRIGHRLGLTVTSTTGGTHVAGSYHYQGRAVDISGSPAQMRRLFLKLRKFNPTELFYDPMGYYYKNGSRVSGAIGGHSDHVHFAL